jgi:cobalamin biosynthesis Co2+ chelatase CbiK
MSIHLASLTHAQVREVIDLALRKETKAGDKHPIGSLDDPANSDLHQLVDVIDRLRPSGQNELMTLVWLGMGTIDDDEIAWTNLLHVLENEPFENVPVQLATMPRLHEYLHRGLGKVS